MLKVIVADDEIRVCRLVQMLADWETLGMEVVGTASNGLEALELIKELQPDILITDIRMPGCNGLELVEKARLASPNLEIALISGYAQFEYAQTAIRYDVGGYLLKPIKKETLTAVLEKLGKKCRERMISVAAMEHLQQNSHIGNGMPRNRLPEDLLHNRLEEATAEILESEYGFHVRKGLLQVFILKLDCSVETFHNPFTGVVMKKAEEVFEAGVVPMCLAGVLQLYGSAVYGVINYEPERLDDIRRELRHCLNQLEAQKFILGAVEFSMAIGKAVDTAEELPVSMRGAKYAIAERLVEGTGRLLENVPEASQNGIRKLLDKYNRAMDRALDTLSQEESDKAVEELKHDVGLIPDMRGYELSELIVSAGKMFAMRLNMDEDAGFINEFEEHCDLCSRTELLFECLRDFQNRRINIVSQQLENEAIRPIRIAKQYIQQHFNEPISLEDVCAATGFSTSYFSTMFKKETGEGFSKYLTRVRIEQAKTLLRDTTLSVAKICVQVGYSDLKHFTSTFKKLTSLNPGQYRKLYG